MLPNPKIEKKKSGNGGGYQSQRYAGGRGNTTHTPEAVGDRLQSPDSLGKEISYQTHCKTISHTTTRTRVCLKIYSDTPQI